MNQVEDINKASKESLKQAVLNLQNQVYDLKKIIAETNTIDRRLHYIIEGLKLKEGILSSECVSKMASEFEAALYGEPESKEA